MREITQKDTRKTLTSIACKYCGSDFVTYNELDFVLHLSETHNLGRGYLYTIPTSYTPSKSRSDDYRIVDAIDSGKRIGVTGLGENRIQKLDLEYSKYLDKTQASIPTGGEFQLLDQSKC